MALAAATKPVRARPIQGWALEKLLDLDAAHPGVLRYAIQASPLRRQAIYLALSSMRPGSQHDLAVRLTRNSGFSISSDPLEAISSALMKRRVRDIVQALYPVCPQGLMGALRKLGEQPLHPLKYRTLIRILAAPDQRRAKVLRQVDRITESTVAVVAVIDPVFIFPELVRHFRSTKDAEAFTATIKLIRQIVPGVTDNALLTSLKASDPKSVEGWAQRWLAKAVFPMLPDIQDDAEWRVLRTGKMMQDAAARFRNCLGGGDRIGACALARSAYVEWLPEPTIIELAAVSAADGQVAHVVEGFHGPQNNGRVPPAVIQAICVKAAEAGLLLPAKLGHARRFNSAARLLNVWDFTGIHGLPDDDVTEIEAFIDELAQEAAA